MSDEDDDGEMGDVGDEHEDFFDHEPNKQEKIEVSVDK